MKCICDKRMNATDSRDKFHKKTKISYRRRRYLCLYCGKKKTTYEVDFNIFSLFKIVHDSLILTTGIRFKKNITDKCRFVCSNYLVEYTDKIKNRLFRAIEIFQGKQ